MLSPLPNQLSGRSADEGDLVPIDLREAAGGVEGMTGPGGVLVVGIDLPDVGGGLGKKSGLSSARGVRGWEIPACS